MEKLQGCGALIKQINDELLKSANNALRPQNITLAQLEVLEQLNRIPEGQYSLKELEQILHVAQSTTAGIISRLERKGLVAGFEDAKDRRIKNVQITPAGVECVQSALHHRIEAEELILSNLTEAERGIFICSWKRCGSPYKAAAAELRWQLSAQMNSKLLKLSC